MQSFQGMINQTATQTMLKGKQILHLVLKKKPLTEEVLEELEKEVSDRMIKFLKRIMPKLENTKFENPEQAIKVILLKALLKILKKLVAEYQKELSPQDQEFVNQIFANEENNIKLEESQMLVDKNKTSIEEEINDDGLNKKKDQCSVQ